MSKGAGTADASKKRKPRRSGAARPSRWESFGIAFLYLLIFPLFPIGAEAIFSRGPVGVPTFALVAATYAVSQAVSCRYVGFALLDFAIGAAFATIFGFSMGLGQGPDGRLVPQAVLMAANPMWKRTTIAAIVLIFVMHLVERYIRHVSEEEPFPEFMGRR